MEETPRLAALAVVLGLLVRVGWPTRLGEAAR